MYRTYSPTLYATPMLRRYKGNPQVTAGVGKGGRGGGGGDGRRGAAVGLEDQCYVSMSTPSPLLALWFYTGPLADISQTRAKTLPLRSFKAALPGLWQCFTSGLASLRGDILTWPASFPWAGRGSENHCVINVTGRPLVILWMRSYPAENTHIPKLLDIPNI